MTTPTSSLAQLFPNPTLVRVLSLFFLHPGERFYQRDIAERTQSALIQVQRALRRMELAGLIRKTREGNRAYYLAEPTHPAFDDLRRAFLKTVSLADVLRQPLFAMRSKINLAFIYGSIARAHERAGSDIDLFVVGEISLLKVTRALGKVQRDLRRELNPAVYPLDEFHQGMKQKDNFLKEVTAGPKIWLVGDQDELERLVG